MEPILEILHETALEHSERAAKLWLESRHLFQESGSKISSIKSAIELNGRASDECQSALNTLKFMQLYKHSIAG